MQAWEELCQPRGEQFPAPKQMTHAARPNPTAPRLRASRHVYFLKGKKKPDCSWKLHIFRVIFPFQAQQPICWHLFAICHYFKFYSCIPFALLMVCHHSHVYTCLALVGENKKGKKGQTENSFLQLSGLVQLRQRQCWLQHALPTGFWAFILFLFFCKQFHTEVLHAEWDQTGLKHLPWGWLAGFTSKPTALEAASHGFLACSLTHSAQHRFIPHAFTPLLKAGVRPTSGAAQITKLHSYKEVWTQALFFFSCKFRNITGRKPQTRAQRARSHFRIWELFLS